MVKEIITMIAPVIVAIVVLVLLVLLAKSMYKVADIDKALIITGGKKPKIIVSGGAFVIPIIRKADVFDLCMLTVSATDDEIMTTTAVPIVADWTAQVRPDVRDEEKLRIAIISFKERGTEGIINDVKLTLMGAVRDIVASKTPEEILRDKEGFKAAVQDSVIDEMSNMGLELVSLNIQDITDRNGYFQNIASLDAADKTQAADIKAAEVNRATREKQASERRAAEIAEANADRDAEIAKMDAEQEREEKRKETDVKIAEFRIQTDTANANAEIAKDLQATIREKELEERRGSVEITRQEQANLAAQKEREVMVTRAEAQKETMRIDAEAEADAARKKAQGEADVETTRAEAHVKVAAQDAEATKKLAEAEAAKTRVEGTAEADVVKAKAEAEAEGIRAKQLAEADGIKAKKLAEAEGEKALAEALAANERVNYEIESLRIQTDAQVRVATATAEIMANLGQNAEFVNITGGNIPGAAGGEGTGNILLDTIMQLPMLMKTLNAQNEALNGRPVTDEVKDISDAALSGLKALRKDDEADKDDVGDEKN